MLIERSEDATDRKCMSMQSHPGSWLNPEEVWITRKADKAELCDGDGVVKTFPASLTDDQIMRWLKDFNRVHEAAFNPELEARASQVRAVAEGQHHELLSPHNELQGSVPCVM